MIINSDGQRCVTMMREDNNKVEAHLLIEKTDFVSLTSIRSMQALLEIVKEHPAFDRACKLGHAGFSYPKINTLEIIEVSNEKIERLKEFGITVDGSFGIGNTIIIDKNMPRLKLILRFHGHSINTLLLDQNCRLRGEFNFEGHENIMVVGAACHQRDIRVTATFRHHAAGLLLGVGGSAAHLNVWIEGPGRSVQIGDDFLFSWGIWLRTADSHGLIDLESGQLVNPSRSILIGPHVWLGQDVMVMGGGQIGGGTTIGARSVVTKLVPSCCVAVGSPARVVRKRVSWTRDARPGAEKIEALQKQTFEPD